MSLLVKFDLNLISTFSTNACKLVDQSKVSNRREFSRPWPKVNQAEGTRQGVCSHNAINSLSENVRKLIKESEARKWREFIGTLIKSWESPNEFAHQIWSQSEQQFPCKCADSINQRTGKAVSSAEREQKLIGSGPDAFAHIYELNLTSIFLTMRVNWSTNQRSRNSRNLADRDQKLIWLGEAANEFAHQISAKSYQRFGCKCAKTLYYHR